MAESLDVSSINIAVGEEFGDATVDNNTTKLITNEIINVLDIEENENKDQIVNDLLESGRQSLLKYEEDIIPEIYKTTMDGNNSKLMNLLKEYFEQQWKIQYGPSNEWFLSFLKQYQDGENRDVYERIVTRTAQHGNKYMKDCPVLSIVLQLLFEGIDDECLNETDVFNELWSTITNHGLKSITKYSDYIIEDVMNIQLNKTQTALFQALREYYREKLFSLLKQNKIADKQNLYSLALDNVAEHGWLIGVQAVQNKIIPRSYKMLFENLQSFQQQQQQQQLKIQDDAITYAKNENKLLVNTQSELVLTEKPAIPNKNEAVIVSDEAMSKAQPNNSMPNITEIEHLSTEYYMQKNNETNIQTSKLTTNQDDTAVIRSTSIQSVVKPNNNSLPLPAIADDDYKNEFNIILSCISEQPSVLNLEDLVEAGELQYINQTLKDISDKLVDNFSRKHHIFPEFIQECLTPIMYLLKRLQNLDDFMNTLISKYQRIQQKTIYQSTKMTNLSLRMLLHVLLMSSDLFLRRIIMSLASKRNPVPFVSPNIHNWNQNETYEFVPAIIHVWDYTRPTILSFGIGPCQGKSTLLNQLFQSTFEQRVDSIYFQQTIDIDFGYCFNPQRTLNIADAHGMIDKKLLQKIQLLFDGFILQIDKTYLDQQPQMLVEYIHTLSSDKFQMIIVRDTPNQNLHECSLQIQNLIKQSELDLSQKLHIHPLVNITNIKDRNITFAVDDLREEVLIKIKVDMPINADRKDEVLPILQKLVKKDYVDYLKKMNKIIQPLKLRLLQKNKYQNEQNFPLYLKFQELCKIRQKLKKLDFYGSESETMFEINTKLYELENELNPHTKTLSIKCGHIFDSLIEILKSDNMLMSLDLLASELKSELSSLGGDKLAGDLAVENAFLSLEVLWRNAVVCCNHTTDGNQDLIIKSYHDFVAAGFPFEIIDGDNFHFQHQFLTKILNEFASQRILVVSIIGPQNSGKSTLLNYMFGTLFDVREGRCTRGIYGSLVKLAKFDQTGKKVFSKGINSKIGDIDYIMLIDTEGLLSIEKGDKEYDRRLVLFALAVSHLVIVNMMGDINQTLQDMLTLCADSLKQIGVNTTNQPIVHFVLNQKADPNLKNHMEAIEKIIKDLKEKQLAEVIDISSKTFHTLPSAFKKERVSADTTSPCFLRTEPDFIERTQQLCEKIIESAISSYERTRDTFSDPPQWLRTAVNIFDTLQKFPDLTYFKDINERRQDDQIRIEIRELISKTLTAAYREQLIIGTCELTEYEIRQQFQVEFNVHQENFDINLDNIFKVTNASENIRDRCKKFLKRQVTEICNAWCTAAIQAHDQKQMEGLVKDGSADLRNLIDDIIKSGRTMNKKEATAEFENMWKNKISSIMNNFNPQERLKQAIKFVYGNYNIFEKQYLSAYEIILQSLQFIIQLSQESDVISVINLIRSNFNTIIGTLQKNVLEVCWKTSNTNTAYTLATLNNFRHLNKLILTDLYAAGSLSVEKYNSIEEMDQDNSYEQSVQNPSTKSSNNGWMKKSVNIVAGALGLKSALSSSSKKVSTLKRTPLPFDFMKIVHDRIHEESASVINTKSHILDIQNLFDSIIKDIITVAHGNETIRRPIEIDLIQRIVSLINANINEINLELLTFKLSLSSQTISLIHTCILFLLTIFYYDEQKNHFNHQLKTLEEQESSLLTYFISMVVPDAECDKEGAKIFANQIRNAIQSNLMRDAQIIITRNIQTQQNLSRKQIQEICDGKLQAAASGDEDWLFRYIDAPTDIIVEEFEVLWKAVEKKINQQLENERNQWRNVLVEFFHRIEFMISSLENEGPSVQYIDDIFQASAGRAADNLKNKGQCMVLLLYTYLSGNKIEAGASFTVFNEKYTLKPKGLKLFQKLPLPKQQLANLIKGMKNVDNSNGNQMAIASIKNLRLFLQSIMNVNSEVEGVYNKSPATFAAFDKDQIYNKLLDKARGCTSKCPCCDRPCDVDHSLIKSNAGDEDNRHACQTGHQLRAMAGIKFEVSDEASLFQCEQMEDNKPIIVRGTKKKWSEFKKDYPDWDFGNSITPNELFRLRGRFLDVWSKIGERLCEKYKMKFVKENTPQAAPKSFHYILMLDASGSMGGTPWNNLLQGVKEFIKIRMDSGTADRITIIVFDDNARYEYFNVDIKTVDIAKIKFTNGCTNFGNAFKLVIQTMQNVQLPNLTSNSAGNLEYIIIFMSDGQAPFPDSQLETLLTMKAKINQFWTVALGQTRMDILEEINQKMGGTFKELKESADLIDVYAEIARN